MPGGVVFFSYMIIIIYFSRDRKSLMLAPMEEMKRKKMEFESNHK